MSGQYGCCVCNGKGTIETIEYDMEGLPELMTKECSCCGGIGNEDATRKSQGAFAPD